VAKYSDSSQAVFERALESLEGDLEDGLLRRLSNLLDSEVIDDVSAIRAAIADAYGEDKTDAD